MSKEGFDNTVISDTPQKFHYSQSNLILMVGGQILIIILALLILISGNRPITFPTAIVQKMFAERVAKK